MFVCVYKCKLDVHNAIYEEAHADWDTRTYTRVCAEREREYENDVDGMVDIHNMETRMYMYIHIYTCMHACMHTHT